MLPFENVSRAPDIEWLRDASVNLLYLDLSRWRDIRIIDDERVADLMRSVPQARDAQLSLETGLAVARRAGAGRLVMGDLLKIGNRTSVVAKVFDVRTGRRERTVRQDAAHPDSLMAIYPRLARAILSVEGTPADTSVIGTGSLEAYREYLDGVRNLNRWELDSAAARFRAALRADSAFALAHYKLSVVLGWQNPDSRERRSSAEAANRLSAALPPRERALIRGQYAQASNRWGEACEVYTELVRHDSADVEAWYNLGECHFHDQLLVPLAGDTSRLQFRGSWQHSLRAFRRALELDPTYHLAFGHIQDILGAEIRGGCPSENTAQCPDVHLGIPLLEGDTISITPIPSRDGLRIGRLSQSRERAESRRRFNEIARDIAQRWVTSGPDEARARLALGRALRRLGRAEQARREMGLVRTDRLSAADLARWVTDRLDLDLKIDSFAAARRMLDTLERVLLPEIPAGQREQASQGLAGVAGMFGELRRAAQLLGAPSPATRYHLAVMRLAHGMTVDSLVEIETAYRDWFVARRPPMQRDEWSWLSLRSSLLASLGRPRPLPALPEPNEPVMRMVILLARGDTAARAALLEVDSSFMRALPEAGDALSAYLVALAWLQLGDSAVAESRLRDFQARLPFTALLSAAGPDVFFLPFAVLPRAWTLIGDLAAARGDAAAARAAYTRALAVLESADAELQPAVARIRQARARLGN